MPRLTPARERALKEEIDAWIAERLAALRGRPAALHNAEAGEPWGFRVGGFMASGNQWHKATPQLSALEGYGRGGTGGA